MTEQGDSHITVTFFSIKKLFANSTELAIFAASIHSFVQPNFRETIMRKFVGLLAFALMVSFIAPSFVFSQEAPKEEKKEMKKKAKKKSKEKAEEKKEEKKM